MVARFWQALAGLSCALKGHDDWRRNDGRRMAAECQRCGRVTSGWVVAR